MAEITVDKRRRKKKADDEESDLSERGALSEGKHLLPFASFFALDNHLCAFLFFVQILKLILVCFSLSFTAKSFHSFVSCSS